MFFWPIFIDKYICDTLGYHESYSYDFIVNRSKLFSETNNIFHLHCDWYIQSTENRVFEKENVKNA